MLRIDWQRRRCWLFNRRLHHGLAGVALTVLGAALSLHDRADWRDWFRLAREHADRG